MVPIPGRTGFSPRLKKHTLQGTNISPKKWHFEDDFPFPKVGYVSPLEGKSIERRTELSGLWWYLSEARERIVWGTRESGRESENGGLSRGVFEGLAEGSMVYFLLLLAQRGCFHAVVMLIPVLFCALSIVLHLILLIFSFSASCSCSSSPSFSCSFSSSPCSCSCCCRCSLHPIWIFLIDSLSIDHIHFRTYTSSCPGVFSTDKTMMQSWMLLKHRDIHCFLDLQAHYFMGYHLFWRPHLVQPVQSPPKATEEKRDGKHHRAGGVKGCSPRRKIREKLKGGITYKSRHFTHCEVVHW